MDHLLDFLFLGSIWLGYSFLAPAASLPWLLALAALSGALMANAFLAFGATGELRISAFGIGPTEMRILFVAANTALVLGGTAWLAAALPWVAAGCAVALVAVVYDTQRRLWRTDMAARADAPLR